MTLTALDHTDLVLRYLAVCILIHVASKAGFSRLGLPVPDQEAKNKPATEKLGRIEWDQTITGFAHSSFVSICYLVVLHDVFFNGTVEDHWAKSTWFSRHGIASHMSFSLYEMSIYVMVGKPIHFYMHHVLVILCFASFLVTGRGHLWCCWLGLVEASNPFLCLLSLMRQVPALKATMFYYVNGFLLWLAYVVFRVVSPLFSVHYMYVEMRDRKDVAWVSEDRSYNVAWIALMVVSVSFVYILSLIWFSVITKGLYKHTMAHLGFDEEKKKRWKGEAAAPKESAKAD